MYVFVLVVFRDPAGFWSTTPYCVSEGYSTLLTWTYVSAYLYVQNAKDTSTVLVPRTTWTRPERLDEENLVELSQRCNSMCERASVRASVCKGPLEVPCTKRKLYGALVVLCSSPYKQEDTGEDKYC